MGRSSDFSVCLKKTNAKINPPFFTSDKGNPVQCLNILWVGNGYCDDLTNTKECNYDGGDCCGSCVITDYCSECVCHLDDGVLGKQQQWIGNGYCDDGLNKVECNFDGGDCCGSNVNTQFCTFCQCQGGNQGIATTTPIQAT